MKKVTDSNFKDAIQKQLNYSFGTIYFLENCVIAEINPGIILSYQDVEQTIAPFEEHYGSSKNVVYISNRIHSYSIKPVDWLKFKEKTKQFLVYCVVGDSHSKFTSLIVEFFFIKLKQERFNDINKAIEWANNHVATLKEAKEIEKTSL